MLEVQKFLHNCIDNSSADSGFDLLNEHFGIKSNFHPTLPLVILNYDQINSQKMHPIVRECRSLVLHTETFEVVSGCMERFFNLGEATEITEKFDWNEPITSLSKEDGSLISLFNFEGEWMVRTRQSWADFPIGENLPRWDELFWTLFPKDVLYLEQNRTYVFEMCSMYNQVVRHYPEPKLFLLTIIDNRNPKEDDTDCLDYYSKYFNRPDKIDVLNIDEAKAYIERLEETDGTAEGLVLQDKNGLRIKVKSKTYLAFSKLGNNGNICSNKALIPIILAGEEDEAVAIFPYIKEKVDLLIDKINELTFTLNNVWVNIHGIENQKEFALALKSFNHPLESILFRMKKEGTIADGKLDAEIRKAGDLLIKVLGD